MKALAATFLALIALFCGGCSLFYAIIERVMPAAAGANMFNGRRVVSVALMPIDHLQTEQQ